MREKDALWRGRTEKKTDRERSTVQYTPERLRGGRDVETRERERETTVQYTHETQRKKMRKRVGVL